MIDQPVQLGNIFVVVIWMNERMATIFYDERSFVFVALALALVLVLVLVDVDQQ